MDPKLSPRIAPRLCAALLPLIVLINSGCRLDKFFSPEHGIEPISPQMSHQALIQHLNQNIMGLHSWSCTDATISTRPSKLIPVKLTLSAQVAVEREKNFRLRAQSPFGNEADFGSNRERFWFWMRRNKPPYVFTAKHEDMSEVGQRLQIPFHPTWIMEALGVAPIDPTKIVLQQAGPQPRTMVFVSEEISPSRTVVRRELLVDTNLGVVLAHRLLDASGRSIAEARLSDHRREPSGIVMPHRIELDWPQHEMTMTMALNNIEVNPSNIPEPTWQLPSETGAQIFDMSRRLEKVETPKSLPPAGERTTERHTYLEPPPFAEHALATDWQATRTVENISCDREPPPFR